MCEDIPLKELIWKIIELSMITMLGCKEAFERQEEMNSDGLDCDNRNYVGALSSWP